MGLLDLTPADHVSGAPDAPVTVIEYGDFQCPYCAAAAPVLRRLVDESDGRVRLVWRNYPLPQLHAYALTAALAAEAAAEQGAFWQMHDLLLTRQDRLTDADLREYGDELGIDGSRLVGEAAQRFGDKVEADFATGVALDVPGTPTLFINGVRFVGRPEIGALRRAVDHALSSDADARLQPGAGRQHARGLRFRRAQREPLAEDA